MAKKIYVVGNWKMYKTAREATDYIEELTPQIQGTNAHVYLAVPYTSIASAANYAKETNIVVGAQNMNDARDGAFTGEIAGLMLKEAGASFVLLGHSERRHIFKESNELIQRKLIRALQDEIQPILCVGETLKEREAGKTEEVLKTQIFSALSDVPKVESSQIIIAYEPVWAIGTGKSASLAHIEEAHQFCRSLLLELFGKKQGGSIPILYGGSVKPENAAEISNQQDVDGVLVGGASLDPETFAQIIQKIAGGGTLKKKTTSRLKKTTTRRKTKE